MSFLIVSSYAGGGHQASCEVVKFHLKQNFPDRRIKVLTSLDQIWRFSYAQLYNYLLQNQKNYLVNLIAKIGSIIVENRCLGGLIRRVVERRTLSKLNGEETKLIVSVVPIFNEGVIFAAKKKNIPFLVIPTDNDLRHWVHGLNRVSYPIRVLVGHNLPTTTPLLLEKGISSGSIHITNGLPIRQEFSAPLPSRAELRRYYNLPLHRDIVLITMGGNGSIKAAEYAEEILNGFPKAHLIVICGRNLNLKSVLEKMRSSRMTVVGYTDKMAEYMALSNVLLSKPGPGTLEEACSQRLPLVLDASELLLWEDANMTLPLQEGRAVKITKRTELICALKKQLNRSRPKCPSRNRFGEFFVKTVHELLSISLPRQSHPST